MAFSACVFSPETIQLDSFELWLQGLTTGEASRLRCERAGVDARSQLMEVVESDTRDAFRLFEELRPSLEDASLRIVVCDVSPATRKFLTEHFYFFDDAVVREFLGKKLTTRTRNTLDEVSEITGTRKRSCVRQFDNCRRLFDASDETGFQVVKHASVAEMLAQEFDLPMPLASRYEAILFVLYHRFSIQTSKKKIAWLSLQDFEACAHAMLDGWCGGAALRPLLGHPSSLTAAAAAAAAADHDSEDVGTPASTGPYYTPLNPFEFNQATLLAFRDLKTKLQSAVVLNDLCTAVKTALESRLPENAIAPVPSPLSSPATFVSENTLTGMNAAAGAAGTGATIPTNNNSLTSSAIRRLEYRLRAWIKALVNVVASLAQPNKVKDFYEDLVVYVIEPISMSLRLNVADMQELFEALDKATMAQGYEVGEAWRLVDIGLRPIVLRILQAQGGGTEGEGGSKNGDDSD